MSNMELLSSQDYEFHLHRMEVLYCRELESANRCFECKLDDCAYGALHGIEDTSA